MPILSLVIPTRNRPTCVLDCVKVALANTEDTEIIVSDNSDTDALRGQLLDLDSRGRIKYRYSEKKLNVIDNFERVLDDCTGDYLMFIGDDDSIGPQIEAVAQWARDQNLDAVTSYGSAFVANYFWPGVVSKYFGNAYAASLFVNRCSGSVEATNPLEALRRVARNPGGGLGKLPRAYHGLVSRRLVSAVRAEFGCLFGGISPDIYSATLIAARCKTAAHLDFPFVIPGASPKSAAGLGAERKDYGDLKGNDHIERFGDSLAWDDRIPRFNSPYTVWAYSLSKAIDQLPTIDLAPEFTRLYACCFMYYPGHWRQTWIALCNHARTTSRIRAGLGFVRDFVLEIGSLLQRIVNKLRRSLNSQLQSKVSNLPAISDAYLALEVHLKSRGITPDLAPFRLGGQVSDHAQRS